MHVHKTSIDGLLLIETSLIEDERGFFLEAYKESRFLETSGRPHRFAQTNHSRSRAGTLRGFHKEAWDKLIYVVRGTALCVVADSRPDSPTFGAHEAFLLGDRPGHRNRIFVSEGLSNAFYCHTEVDYLNDVSGEYDATKRGGFIWNDPTVGVQWPTADPLLSPSDARLPTFRALFPDHPHFARPAG